MNTLRMIKRYPIEFLNGCVVGGSPFVVGFLAALVLIALWG